MKVTVIPIVIGAFGIVTKGLVQDLEELAIRGRMETIKTIALLESVGILSLKLLWKKPQQMLEWKTLKTVKKRIIRLLIRIEDSVYTSIRWLETA